MQTTKSFIYRKRKRNIPVFTSLSSTDRNTEKVAPSPPPNLTPKREKDRQTETERQRQRVRERERERGRGREREVGMNNGLTWSRFSTDWSRWARGVGW